MYSSPCAKGPSWAARSQQEAWQPLWAHLSRVLGTSSGDGERLPL